MGKYRELPLTAALSLIYAVAFIALYFIGVPLLYGTFFIWENLFIDLLFLELYMVGFGEVGQ